jgi:endonuclease/exonuclease/phosphatase (EEP) superfamily protein YafD
MLRLALAVAVAVAARRRPALLLVASAWAVSLTARLVHRPVAARPAATFTVACANLLCVNRSPAAAAKSLAALDADVVVTVETTPELFTHLSAVFDGSMVPVATAGPSPDVAVVIWARPGTCTPAVAVQAHDLSFPAVWYHAAGVPVRVVGVHVTAPRRRRHVYRWSAQLADIDRQLRAASRSEPVVVAGDWNTSALHPVFPTSHRWRPATHSQWVGPVPTWPAIAGGRRSLPLLDLDHVVVTDPLVPVSCRRVRIPGSDHLAVVAEIASWGLD